jgi:hypothetical protein
MQQEIESYKEWQEAGFHINDNEVPQTLNLSQTYQEWLREHPEGYTS